MPNLRRLAFVCALFLSMTPAAAQQTQSRLYEITKSGVLRVCIWPMYYSISFRNPDSGQLEGIDIDLSKELAKDMGVKLDYVETSFGSFIADLQANKCDLGMFGVGATMKRAQAVAFSDPYLTSGVYAVVRKGGPITSWADIDKPGVNAGVSLGSYVENFMRSYFKNAKTIAVAPPATTPAELMAQRVDVVMTDYPASIKMNAQFDWTTTVAPPENLSVTPYAYVMNQGDQIWLNYVNLFVRTIKLDGRLKAAAEKNKLGPIVAP
ncbi:MULTISPECIES: ABC transporter substrate-binding protein [Bradyrhizobium]|jgi:ABC-type amino acid transport substrate-binding protein|uniref:ABC transporter substrate-binding protein n=1 Tax=Bradyrhizobium TaxID=374 RepID=UPI0004829174|nr:MULTISPECIES: ABC transporter substrate-binding protein [Bradyrhizobium]MCS3449363.1 ABC-type amino acid transport substrate-binding protein [Bradyrhizobium elkanii]MCS3559494.1 ABC-type amino acid transport substrate-binding protein [Bradyrhizobium elkanii]MCW2150660.1 ABC-type amino acid transport substrate-binding protein [Bradyrhizobium elkanii]MCW2359281.1 ABC-type amino acid transport substrate-binding protein [Bradyrhizobium elkanii]MCW2374391.1 ABC-type amino acid transport substrat